MLDSHGYLVDQEDVQAHGVPGDTVSERVTIDRSSGCELLQQRVLRFAPGHSRERVDPDRHHLLFVVSGSGRLLIEGETYVIEPDTGVFIAAGERWSIENRGDKELVAVEAVAPADRPADPTRRRVVVRLADQPSLPATPNREFRYLVNEEAGCLDVTQFVGLIPPGRPGMHSHTYDEILYVIEGEGMLHMNDVSQPIRAGSCMHLPPLREHAVENTGSSIMRVLGVFHPSGDPASRAYEET